MYPMRGARRMRILFRFAPRKDCSNYFVTKTVT